MSFYASSLIIIVLEIATILTFIFRGFAYFLLLDEIQKSISATHILLMKDIVSCSVSRQTIKVLSYKGCRISVLEPEESCCLIILRN